ncbi:unannotated protein [freshwater metagenome]|uniref:Unannotated protein n=1 Tax=freshwater metagenome TaxID=449393 RepID=A0A6J5YBF3_9ZZZZ
MQPGRFGGEAGHCLFDCHHRGNGLGEGARCVVGSAECEQMRTTIAGAGQREWMSDDLLGGGGERGISGTPPHEDGFEFVGQRKVDHGIDPGHPSLIRELGDRATDRAAQGLIGHRSHTHRLPTEHERTAGGVGELSPHGDPVGLITKFDGSLNRWQGEHASECGHLVEHEG